MIKSTRERCEIMDCEEWDPDERNGCRCFDDVTDCEASKRVKKSWWKIEPGASQTQFLIREECKNIMEILLGKNRKYGDSAINPVRIFSQADPAEQINVRLDDKISRLQSGQSDDTEDIEIDLIGYLILKRVERRVER